MAAYENSVEEIIVQRIKTAFLRVQKDGKIPDDKLFMLKTRLFDYAENDGEAVDNSHFFPETIREILFAQIAEAMAQITAIHPPAFYEENNFQKIPPNEQLLKEIEDLFLDQDKKVKPCYVNAFGGAERIKEIFKNIEFENAQGIFVGKNADPLDKFKDFLINAYYDHCKQEFGYGITSCGIDQESPEYISQKLWEGFDLVQLAEMAPGAYTEYKKHVSSPQHAVSLMTGHEITSLRDLLQDDVEENVDDLVEDTIVSRIHARLQRIREGQGEISSERLKQEQTRLFDATGGNPDNTSFFPAPMKRSLEQKIEEARTNIIAIHSSEFYQQNNFETAKQEMKQSLLQEIEAIFVDPTTNTVKQSYIDAFGGIERINTLFVGEGFTDVNGHRLPETATPLDKLKSVLINAYYNQYNHELHAKAVTLPGLQEWVNAAPEISIAIALWEGKNLETAEIMFPDAYTAYRARRRATAEVHEIPETASLHDIVDTSDTIDSLLEQSNVVNDDLLRERPHYFSSSSGPTLFRPPRCDSPINNIPSLGVKSSAVKSSEVNNSSESDNKGDCRIS